MITVKVNEWDLLDMLMDRVKVWKDDEDVIKLYELYYQSMIDNGCFDGAELDINQIVDNDVINWLMVMDSEELEENGWTDSDRVIAEYNGYYLVYAC